jgi:DNA-binding PadR family transcriptional regulator
MPTTSAADLLPLTPAVLHILLALADGERHGYAIAQDAESLSGGRVRMGPGTLYGSIQRMLSSGLLEETPVRADDGGRRFYRATALGQRALALELDRLARVVDHARARRLLPRPEAT